MVRGVKLSVKVTEQGTNGQSVSGSQVRVLQDGTLAGVASGTLDSALGYAANVSAGQYEVCVKPPTGWGSAARGTEVLAGLGLLRGRPREGAPARDVPPDAADPRGEPVSAHGRRGGRDRAARLSSTRRSSAGCWWWSSRR